MSSIAPYIVNLKGSFASLPGSLELNECRQERAIKLQHCPICLLLRCHAALCLPCIARLLLMMQWDVLLC